MLLGVLAAGGGRSAAGETPDELSREPLRDRRPARQRQRRGEVRPRARGSAAASGRRAHGRGAGLGPARRRSARGGRGPAGAGVLSVAFELTFISPLGALACLAAVLPLAARRARPETRRPGRPPRSGCPARRSAAAAGCSSPPPAAPSGSRPPSRVIDRDDGRRGANGRPGALRRSTSPARCSPRRGPTTRRGSSARAARRSSCADGDPAGSGRPRRADRPGAAVPLPDARHAHVRLDAAGGGRDRVAAAAAGRPRRHELRRSRFARHAGFFAPGLERRVCVVLTDGESAPFAGAGRGLPVRGRPALGSRPSAIYRDGEPEAQYRPDDAAPALAAQARARRARGRPLRARASSLAAAVGEGPSGSSRATSRTRSQLAPYAALVGLALVLWLVLGRRRLPADCDASVPWSGA